MRASRRRGAPRRGMGDTAGFTLIEVLLATVLLAAGLTIAFATLRSATAISARGEQMADRNERLRAVEGFLRRRISAALPMAMARDPAANVPVRFTGEADAMAFVADLPPYLGRGGPYRHSLAVVEAGGRSTLTVAFAMVQAGEVVDDAGGRPPEVLADDLRSVRFAYRGLAEDGKPGEWAAHWERVDALPLQVRIEIEGMDGRRWPAVVVAVPRATNTRAFGNLQ